MAGTYLRTSIRISESLIALIKKDILDFSRVSRGFEELDGSMERCSSSMLIGNGIIEDQANIGGLPNVILRILQIIC